MAAHFQSGHSQYAHQHATAMDIRTFGCLQLALPVPSGRRGVVLLVARQRMQAGAESGLVAGTTGIFCSWVAAFPIGSGVSETMAIFPLPLCWLVRDSECCENRVGKRRLGAPWHCFYKPHSVGAMRYWPVLVWPCWGSDGSLIVLGEKRPTNHGF